MQAWTTHQGRHFGSDYSSRSRSRTDSRDPSVRRQDSRDPSFTGFARVTQRHFAGLSQPVDERIDNLDTALSVLEERITRDAFIVHQLGKELLATKHIVRYLVEARQRDMNWFNRYAGGGPPLQSHQYWYEEERIISVLSYVMTHNNWQNAWDDHGGAESE